MYERLWALLQPKPIRPTLLIGSNPEACIRPKSWIKRFVSNRHFSHKRNSGLATCHTISMHSTPVKPWQTQPKSVCSIPAPAAGQIDHTRPTGPNVAQSGLLKYISQLKLIIASLTLFHTSIFGDNDQKSINQHYFSFLSKMLFRAIHLTK